LRRVAYTALGIVFCIGCDREPVRRAPAGPTASEVASARQAIAAKLVASALSEVRSQRISLSSPEWETQHVAFGRRLFVRLGEDSLEAFALPSLASLFSAPLEGPRGVVELAGGSVLAIGERECLRVDPDAKIPVRLPRIFTTPGVTFLPERRDSSLVWALHRAGGLLARHELVLDRELSLRDTITLEGYDGGSVAAMKNGELLYRASDGIRLTVPEGRPRRFRYDARPFRLLPARRVDQAFAVSAAGDVELLQLGEGILVRKRFALGAAPISVATSGDTLAAVLVHEGGKDRTFSLRVFSSEGKELLSRELGPGAPPEGEDWVARLVADHGVALSADDARVAVGGPRRLRVFSLSDGGIVLER
jgi:hypothetical protein